MIRLRIIPLPLLLCCAAAQGPVLLNFDNAPLYASLPLNVVAGGITAHLSATGQGYSIQSASTAPVAPIGFTGHYIYPNSINLADLIVDFSQPLTSFSILYAPQELGCDDSARMRVTAYRNSVLVGANTTTAPNPGTWPVSPLSCAFAQGFDRVVVHYDARPPTCQDWGPIFLCDDMTVIAAPTGSYSSFGAGCAGSLPASQILALQPPRINSVLQLSLDNLPADAAFLFTGWSNTTSSLGPLPLACAPLGMPGCVAYTSIDAVSFVAGSAGGAVLQITIPNLAAFVGAQFYQQAVVLDPAFANPLHAVMSEAKAAAIGL